MAAGCRRRCRGGAGRAASRAGECGQRGGAADCLRIDLFESGDGRGRLRQRADPQVVDDRFADEDVVGLGLFEEFNEPVDHRPVLPAGEIGDYEIGKLRLRQQQSQRCEHAVARHALRLLAEKSQRHHRRVGFGEGDLAAATVQEEFVDQVEAVGPPQRDITRDQGIEAAADLRLLRAEVLVGEDRADPFGIGLGAAGAEHGGVEPPPVGLHLGILDPLQELRRIHPVGQAADIGIGCDGELVIRVAGERLVGVFQVPLKERQTIGPLLREGRKFSQVLDGPLADRDRTRPDELRRLDTHEQEERAHRLLLQQDRFDRRAVGGGVSGVGDEVGALEHFDDGELALGQRPLGARRQGPRRWRLHEPDDRRRLALRNLLRKGERHGRTERAGQHLPCLPDEHAQAEHEQDHTVDERVSHDP